MKSKEERVNAASQRLAKQISNLENRIAKTDEASKELNNLKEQLKQLK